MKHSLQCLIFFPKLKLSRKEEALKDLISKIGITVIIPIELMMSLKWLVFFLLQMIIVVLCSQAKERCPDQITSTLIMWT